jgi:hypothetical protein
VAGNEIVVNSDSLNSETVVELFRSGDIHSRKLVFAAADAKETAQRIALRDLNATSLDELLGGSSDVISGRDYVNKPFTLTAVEWQQSDIVGGEGLPFYAVCHIATIDGEAKVLTTGAASIVRKVAKMAAEGWLPAKVKIVKAAKTEAGYEPLDLALADF